MLTSHVCTKCAFGLVALEKAEIDLHAFKQQTLSSVTALQSTKVTGGKVGVSSDIVRARPIKIKLLINNLVYLETILLFNLYA